MRTKRKKLNKLFSAIMAAVLILSAFSACSGEGSLGKDSLEEGKIKVVATIFPPYDFSRQIGGERAEVTMLMPPGGESHSYEPTPQDMLKVKDCDVFICVGGESDIWANNIIDTVNNDDMLIIKMMDCVELTEEEHDSSHVGNDHEIEYDEHVWTSPVNAMEICKAISDALISADGEGEEYYTGRLNDYLDSLSELDEEFRQIVAEGKRNTLVFGDRFPFRYFAKEYSLECYAAFPGCSVETDVSASVMASLIEKVKEENIPAVYYVEFSSQKIADSICDETGAEPLLLHSCHTVSKEDFDKGITYIQLMEQNAENLRRGLA